MFTESVNLMVCVAMVSLGENKDLIGPWMTFCESQKITVDMSFYMHSLLFRYLDWNQSWMRQTAEVYDIQIDSNLKWLWPFRLINSFPAYHHFLLNTQFIKIKFVNQGLTCLIFPTFSGITESPLKSLNISRILALLLVCGMPTGDAYSSGHLVLSHFGTCMCSNVETNLSWTCLVFGPLNFEHPSVLLFCLLSVQKSYSKYHFQLQPSTFWSWCSEFHSAIMILSGLAVSVSTCWTCCHRWPYLYSWQRITVTL